MSVTIPLREAEHPRRVTTTRPRWWPRLGARTRKVTLIVHLASVAGWIGMHVVLGVLIFTGLGSAPAAAASFAVAMTAFVGWPLVAFALLALCSGVVLGLGSKYGLLRYWWVFTKLAITLVMIVLILVVLIPSIAELAAAATDASSDFAFEPSMVFPPIVSTSMLLFAIVLSVIKPWGRTRRAKASRP